MSARSALFFAILIDTLFLSFYTTQLSIGYDEARLIFDHASIAGVLAFASCEIFGMSDLAARAPFILLHIASLFLLYNLSSYILKKETDRVLAVVIFMLLPSVNLSALLINKSGVIIFLTLLFVALLKRGYVNAAFVLLAIYALIDNAFAVLFLALIFYGMGNDDKKLIVINLVLFAVNMYLFGFDDGGKPKSAFLDTFGVYLAIFSPLLFLYFLYSLYKSFAFGSKEPLFYISFWALVFSVIVSIRQKIHFEDFAPFTVIAVICMVKVFFSSYRVRLRVHRRGYKLLGYTLFASLVLSTTVLFGSKLLYPVLENPKNNFAYNYHVARELSVELKRLGINSVATSDDNMALRLAFYGIKKGDEWRLSKTASNGTKKVSIIYTGRVVTSFYVTKVNTL